MRYYKKLTKDEYGRIPSIEQKYPELRFIADILTIRDGTHLEIRFYRNEGIYQLLFNHKTNEFVFIDSPDGERREICADEQIELELLISHRLNWFIYTRTLGSENLAKRISRKINHDKVTDYSSYLKKITHIEIPSNSKQTTTTFEIVFGEHKEDMAIVVVNEYMLPKGLYLPPNGEFVMIEDTLTAETLRELIQLRVDEYHENPLTQPHQKFMARVLSGVPIINKQYDII